MENTIPVAPTLWLEKHMQDTHCVVYRQNTWTAGDEMLYLDGRHGRIPLCILVCADCGHTLFINARVMRLV